MNLLSITRRFLMGRPQGSTFVHLDGVTDT
jgi:hypothetical protein